MLQSQWRQFDALQEQVKTATVRGRAAQQCLQSCCWYKYFSLLLNRTKQWDLGGRGKSCMWFTGSQDGRRRRRRRRRTKGVVQWPGAGWLLAHMSKPKGRAACLRTHLGPIRNTSHGTHTQAWMRHTCTHTQTYTGRVEAPHCPRRKGKAGCVCRLCF